jgi:predicted 3-demethylubiquinone-9 3-methyltransferase (glyoxalase superfamily)
MQKITPFLWFDNQAEEAANFYTSIFKNSKITSVHRMGEETHGPANNVLIINFQLDGQNFTALNGGPMYKFTPAISLYVDCQTQAEIDFLWDKLSDGGHDLQCGWLTDKYGITWQIIPSVLGELMTDKDPAKAKRVMDAMLKMVKLDIAELQRAANQG